MPVVDHRVRDRLLDLVLAWRLSRAGDASPRTPAKERARRAAMFATGQFPVRWRRARFSTLIGVATAAPGQLRFLESSLDPTQFNCRPSSVWLEGRAKNMYGRTRILRLDCGETAVVLHVAADYADRIVALLAIPASR